MPEPQMVELTDDLLTTAALAACAAFADVLDLKVQPVMVNPVAAVMAVETAIRDALASWAEGHDWERTALNGDGGTGDYYEWACRRCDRREWSCGVPERNPEDPGCATSRAIHEPADGA